MGGFRVILTLLLAGSLSACAGLSNIHWRFPGPGGKGQSQVFTTDAMQRHLVMSQDMHGRLRVCAEASPDAMTVFNTSITAGGLFGPTQRELDAAVAVGQAASTIERTQTINMLREWMYRTCELWLSGALSKEEFLTRSARDHRSMIAILSVEQLTGVVKPPATILTGPAVRALSAQTERVAELLETYQAERATAETAERTATDDYAKLNERDNAGTKIKLCDVIDPSPLPADLKTDHGKCAGAKSKLAAATAVANTARGREKQVLDQLAELSGGLASGVSGGWRSGGGLDADDRGMSDTALAAIGGTIERIALTAGVDEALMFCVGYLRNGADPHTRSACNKVVVEAATADRALMAGQVRASHEEADSADERRRAFGAFNRRLTDHLAPLDDAGALAFIAAFETQAGFRLLSAGNPKLCTTKSRCVELIGQDIYFPRFDEVLNATLIKAIAGR